MTTKVGSRIPYVVLFENTSESKVNAEQLTKGRTIVLFGVLGAFMPECSTTHLNGYIRDADELKKKGVDEIVCVSVNDPYVMAAWGKINNAGGKVRMLADPAAAFSKAVHLTLELPPLGTRSKRYSMVIKDGVIQELNVEPDGTGLTCSLSKNIQV